MQKEATLNLTRSCPMQPINVMILNLSDIRLLINKFFFVLEKTIQFQFACVLLSIDYFKDIHLHMMNIAVVIYKC